MPIQSLAEALCKKYSHFLVGSFPYSSATQAIELILENSHLVPCWPELPQRAAQEKMLARAQRAYQDGWAGYLPNEASGLFELVRVLKVSNKRLPLLKLQLMGPLSLALWLSNRDFTTIEKCSETCLKQIQWQIAELRPLAEKLLVVLDDPGFYLWHELSSQQKQAVFNAYSYLFISVQELGAWFGLHSCSGVDPEILSLPIELWSFSWMEGPELRSQTQALKPKWIDALKRGVVLAPGIFPCRPTKPYAESYNQALQRHQKFIQDLENYSGKGGIVMSAECGFAESDAEWVQYLLQKI